MANIDISGAIDKLKGLKQQVPELVIQAVETACIQVVIKARMLNTYLDHTHKLRSSIGYVIYYNGKEARSNFESTGGDKGDEGVRVAQNKAAEYASHYDGIVAVIVAGAEYASYVEANGYDVITGPALELQKLFNDELRNLNLI